MRAIIHNHDMIAKTCGPGEGVEVGDKPAGVGLERLRFDGSQLVDIATLSEFYVVRRDGSWELHAVEVPGSQLVQMSHKQKWRLVNDDGTYRLKTDAELLGEAQEAKIREVDAERAGRCEMMPYTTPDGASVEIKIGEYPPGKPRQTWLSGASARALAAKVKGESFSDDLIAADDSRHTMNEDIWVSLGEELHKWVRDHINAAKDHAADINAYTTIEDVENHDLTLYWP